MPSDFDRISEDHCILSELGYNSFRGLVLHNPKFKARGRCPDLLIKHKLGDIVIEDDGPIHGSFDQVTESEQTRHRNDDYFRAGYFPIILNEEWLQFHKISKKTYLKCVLANLESHLRANVRVGIEKIVDDIPPEELEDK